MDKQLYNELKLFPGAIAELARRYKCHYQNLRFCLRDGKWQDEKMLEMARTVLKERKKAMKSLLTQA